MPRAKTIRPLLALGAVLAATAARGQAPTFVYAASAYEDEKAKAFKDPEGVACAEGGAVVVADTGNGRLVRLKYEDGAFTGGTEIKLAELPYPARVQIDRGGALLVLDRKLSRVGRVDASGAFAGYLEPKGVQGAEAVAASAFKVEGSGNVVLLDGAALRVLVLDPAGNVTRQLELPKPPAYFVDVATDGAGTLYALDGVGGKVWSAPRGATSFSILAQGLKEVASFPAYLAASRGWLYVVDQNGSGLVVLGPDGSYQGRQLSIGWDDGLVYYPAQLCIGPKGEAVVADRGNNRIQVFTASK